MLWDVTVLLSAIAVVFSILSFLDRETLIFPLVSATTWFILSPCFFHIEKVVSVNVNAVNATVSEVSNIVSYYSAWPIGIYSLGLGVVFVILTLYRVFRVPQEFVEGVRRSGSSV